MNEEIIKRAEEILAKRALKEQGYCVLALIDADGYPTAARITPSKTDGIKQIIVGNNINSNWAKRALKCNRASVCYSSERPEYNVTLVGTIEVLTNDFALKKEVWNEWMKVYYRGPEDSDFCVLRFNTRRYSIFADGKQVRGTL